MHCSVFRDWVVLPALIASATCAVSSPRTSSDLVVDSSTGLDRGLQSIYTDDSSVQASFVVPCLDCGPLKQDFLFNLQAFPSEQPCGPNNVSLNGIPIDQQWESTATYAQGEISTNSSGHALKLLASTNCLDSSKDEEAQVLTVTILDIDREGTGSSLPGFTLSFKQYPKLELLRLSLTPDLSARIWPYSEQWRNPPEDLRLPVAFPQEQPTADDGRPLSLEEQLADLQRLEAQADELIKLIEEKKNFINSQFPEAAKCLKQEIKDCDSFLCVVKAIGSRIRGAAHAAYAKFHDTAHAYTNWKSSAGGQSPTMLASTDVVTQPEDCHCRDSRPGAQPPPYKADGFAVAQNEKSPALNGTQPRPGKEPEWKEATDPSIFLIVLKFLAVITGLAFLFSLFRRCCMSDRKRVERAAERERKATEALYKSAARRQSWRDWWNGRKRGKPGYRTGDYEEKRGLILQQETILEGRMQDEIQQLRIQEEIRQLRNTRDAVDDLVRAEEGRNHPPSYTAAASSSGTRSHPFGFHPIPAPITIPSASSRMYPTHHDIDDQDHPGTPLSRTSSLPDYKTDGSEPPGYESDRRSSFSSQAALSEYAHSTHTTDSVWSPGSSIPDISPRPSMETALTVETARTFV